MSPLLRYLAPLRPPRQNPGYRVEWRHGEGGPWSPLDPAQPHGVQEGQVEDLLASPPVSLVQGDLVRVWNMNGKVVGFSVMTREGLQELPSGEDERLQETMCNEAMNNWYRDCGHDWEKAWERSKHADWMLDLASWARVDRKLLVLAVCDCAETVVHYVPPVEGSPRAALEAARRWARDEVGEEEVLRAHDEAMDAAPRLGPQAQRTAAYVAAAAAQVALQTSTWSDAGDAAEGAARATSQAAIEYLVGVTDPRNILNDRGIQDARGEARAVALENLAVLVRQRIPLWQFALALASAIRAPW